MSDPMIHQRAWLARIEAKRATRPAVDKNGNPVDRDRARWLYDNRGNLIGPAPSTDPDGGAVA